MLCLEELWIKLQGGRLGGQIVSLGGHQNKAEVWMRRGKDRQPYLNSSYGPTYLF